MSRHSTVQQASRILEVDKETLLSWEKEFAEYLKLELYNGKKRRYNQKQMETLSKIKDLLFIEQYTIKGAKRRMDIDNILLDPLGVDSNFKSTVVFMLSSIMKELQKTQDESKKLAAQVEYLRDEKKQISNKLWEEQNKGIKSFFFKKLRIKQLAHE